VAGSGTADVRGSRGWLVGAGAIAAVAIVVVVGVVVAGSDGGDSVDATTTTRPAPEPVGEGASGGPNRVLWSADLDADEVVVRRGVLVVLARDGHGVVAYDVGTGRERWRYRDGDALTQAFHVAADRVSLVLQRGTSSTGDRESVTLDLLSGRRAGGGRIGVDEVGRAGDVAVVINERSMAGLDVDSTDPAWRWMPSLDCGGERSRVVGAREADGVALAQVRCGPRSGTEQTSDFAPGAVAAVDVASGTPLWSILLPPGGALLDAGPGGALILGGTIAASQVAVHGLRTGTPGPAVAVEPGWAFGLVGHLVGDGWCGVRPAGGGTSVACYGPAGQPHGSANLFAEPADSVATGGDIVLAAQSRRPWVSVVASDDLRAPPVTITGELPDDADRLLVSGGAVVVAGGTGGVAVLVRDD
jgi:outer membrane protein assembly factor BamB